MLYVIVGPYSHSQEKADVICYTLHELLVYWFPHYPFYLG